MTKTTVKQYFKDCFKRKLLIRKGIIAAIACALVLVFSLSFFFWLKGKEGTPFGTNGFWYIQIAWNPGIAWSSLANKPGAIFAIQAIVSILMICIFLLLCKDDFSSSFIACAIFGGLFNLFQRAGVPNNMVLDYFQFGFWKDFPVFNWPDMFVVIGIFGFVISYIIYLVKLDDNENDDNKKQESENSVVKSLYETR